MIVQDRISIPEEALAELCRRYYVRELALFGSVLRDDFREDSDIDVLVEFEPGAPIGLFEFVGLKQELADLLGRDVDLVEKAGLKEFLRDRVLHSAQVIYAPNSRVLAMACSGVMA
jgi:predicted nucleotidyltransferase